MPTYDYVCDACGHHLEILQKITEPPLVNCPKCQKAELKKKFGTGVGLKFSGSGFYSTDYKSDSNASSSSCCPCGKNKPKCSS